MSRPFKNHLDSIIMPVNMLDDMRLQTLIRVQGAQALGIYVALLASICGQGGYYAELNDDLSLKVATQCQVPEEVVRRVIDSCCTLGLFDTGMAMGPKVLTSADIQQRWLKEVTRRQVDIDRYSLIKDHMPQPQREEPEPADPLPPPAPSQEGIYNDMRSSWMWLESMAMQHHMEREQILNFIDEFQNHCRCIDKIHDNSRAAKQHFNNWLYNKQRIENEQSTTHKSGTQADGRQQRAAAYAAAIANLAAQDDSRATTLRRS
jgi:hypothetical protein